MSDFVALIDESNGRFGVSFSDAPGCTAMATTREQALADRTDALVEWLEDEHAAGRAAPSPRPWTS